MAGSLRWLAIACALTATGCTSVLVRGGPSYDAGTLEVSGLETGTGWQVEALGYARSAERTYGLGVVFQRAGYSTAGDADPMAFTTLEARYRRRLGPRSEYGPYWEFGSGIGAAWTPSIDRVAVPLQIEAGIERGAGRALLSLGVRERFLPLVGTGSPPFDAFNSLQLVGGLGLEVGHR